MPITDYSRIQTVLFDLDGTILTGLGPYESSLEQAVKETFGKEVKVDLSSFHGLTDREILYRTLQQNSYSTPKRNSNPNFESQISECLNRFGEVYQADSSKTKLLPGAEEILYKMNIEGGPVVHTKLVTGNVEQMARKKLALFRRDEEDNNEELRYQGLNLYFSSGAFGNQSYYRENLVSLAIQNIERERIRREEGSYANAYSQIVTYFKGEREEYERLRKDMIIGTIIKIREKITGKKMEPPVFNEPDREEYKISANDIYVVGDTSRDIDAGLRARELYPGRIFTVGVLTGTGTEEQLKKAGADYVINNLSQLSQIIPNKVYEYSLI